MFSFRSPTPEARGRTIYLFIYTLFKVDLHITLQQKPINMYLLYKHRAVNKKNVTLIEI